MSTFVNLPAVGIHDSQYPHLPLVGGGLKMEFCKQNRQWVGNLVENWIY